MQKQYTTMYYITLDYLTAQYNTLGNAFFFGWGEIAPSSRIEGSASANQNGIFAIGVLYDLCCLWWGLSTDH